MSEEKSSSCVPQFSGKKEDWENFKMKFIAYLSRKKCGEALSSSLEVKSAKDEIADDVPNKEKLEDLREKNTAAGS